MERVAVVDFDVHHGNGTEDVLCRTRHPGFFYASIHAFNRGGGDGSLPRIFPGTGAADEAHSHVLNVPLGDQVGGRVRITVLDGVSTRIVVSVVCIAIGRREERGTLLFSMTPLLHHWSRVLAREGGTIGV